MSSPAFSKKARLPRKEKKRRARMLNPRKKIKHLGLHYHGLTYAKLEEVVRNALFPESTPGVSLESHKFIWLDELPDKTIHSELSTVDEIKKRFEITAQEEEALITLAQTTERKLLEASYTDTAQGSTGETPAGNRDV
jgi:hypothetical protein